MKLLIVGDRDLRIALVEQFASEPEILLLEAETAQQGLGRLGAGLPDVLLVADELSSEGATTVLRAARALGFAGPAILLARGGCAAAQEFDACLHRPLRFAELNALIARAWRRPAARVAVTLGDHKFCEMTQTLTGRDGACRSLTEKEAAILARLARAHGGVVPRDVLLRDIWGYNPAITTHTLETHIHRLRRKIERSSRRPRLLLTAQGGYRLSAAGDCADNDAQPFENG